MVYLLVGDFHYGLRQCFELGLHFDIVSWSTAYASGLLNYLLQLATEVFLGRGTPEKKAQLNMGWVHPLVGLEWVKVMNCTERTVTAARSQLPSSRLKSLELLNHH